VNSFLLGLTLKLSLVVNRLIIVTGFTVFGEKIMVSAHMIPSEILIDIISEELKSEEKTFQPPTWAEYVKMGVSRENAPEQRKGWWFIRVASILRKIYINGPIGVMRLKKDYGGRKNRGSKPEKTKSGSGSIIRLAIHQLEKAGYVTNANNSGRVVTPAGRSFVDKMAMKAKEELPELSKY
jgi:small subunit ribosomal protein S19e